MNPTLQRLFALSRGGVTILILATSSALALGNTGMIFNRLDVGYEYLLTTRGASDGLDYYAGQLFSFDTWARVSVFIGWAVIGAIFYSVFWLVYRVALDLRNHKVFVTHYTHQQRFSVSNYIGEIAIITGLKAAAVLAITFFALFAYRTLYPLASLLFADWLYHLSQPKGWGSLLLALVLMSAAGYGLLVLARLLRLSTYLK